jgi:hypothetical protein
LLISSCDETKIQFFDITNEEYARAETYKSLALEMDKVV